MAVNHARAPSNRRVHALAIRITHALERDQDEGRIVEIGVELVAEFKRPAGGPDARVVDLQSPGPVIC